jgi:hypothetical protein
MDQNGTVGGEASGDGHGSIVRHHGDLNCLGIVSFGLVAQVPAGQLYTIA